MNKSRAIMISLAATLACMFSPAFAQDTPQITSEGIDQEYAARHAAPELRWQAGCATRNGRDCTIYAAFLVNRSKTPTPKDAEAVGYLERGCSFGDPAGCRLLAAFRRNGRGGPADPIKARAALARACQLGDKAACEK